jgi:hypothetical protein
MRQLFLFVLAILVLAGCGGSPDADQSSRATSISGGSPAAQATAGSAAGATSGPAAQATVGSAAGATSGPASGVATATSALAAGRAQQEYNSLIVLKAAASLFEEAARPRPTPASGGAGAGKSVATLLKAAGDRLKLDSSDTSLEPVWLQAREAHAKLLDLYGRWTDEKVTATELTGELEPIQKQLDQILDTAEGAIAKRYGGDEKQLQQRRQEALRSLVGQFVTPAP